MQPYYHYPLAQDFFKLAKFGNTGVDLFFMISGFVILFSLEQVSHLRTFVVNRFARLYPVYFLCATFLFFSVYFHWFDHEPTQPYSWKQWLINLTFLNDWFSIPNLDSVYWTLHVEIWFYGLLVLLWKLKQLPRIVFWGSAICGLLVFLDFLTMRHLGFQKLYYQVFPLAGHFPLFYAGMLFYRLKQNSNSGLHKVLIYLGLLLSFISEVYLFGKVGYDAVWLSRDRFALALFFY